MWLIISIIFAVLIGLPLGIALGGLLLSAAASLCNVEHLRYLRACGIVALEAVIALPISFGSILLLGLLGHSLEELREPSLEQFVVAVLLGAVQLVLILLSIVLFRFLIPVGFLRAGKIWLFRFLMSLLLYALISGMALVGLAIFQIATRPSGVG
jgi:hypothetical protein